MTATTQKELEQELIELEKKIIEFLDFENQ